MSQMSEETATESMSDGEAAKPTNAAPLAQVEIGLTSEPLTFGELIKKAIPVVLESRKYMFLKLAFYTVIGVFIGSSYYGIGNDGQYMRKNVSCLFYTLILTIFMGMMPTFLMFPQQMANFEREYSEEKSTVAFYTAKTWIDMLFLILVSSIYTSIVYILTSQPHEFARAFIFVVICVMTTLISYSFALFIAVELRYKSKSQRTVMAVATVLPFVILAGYWVRYDSIPEIFLWMKSLSYVRYAFEGVLIAIYGFGREFFVCNDPYCQSEDPRIILKEYGMDESHVSIVAVALVLIFMAIQAFTIVALQWRTKSDRSRIN